MDRIKLETKHVSIEFPGVKALDDINFEVTTGEIRAVVGANGAGKSTLMKVLAGANSTYTGDVLLNGKKVEVRTPVDAKKLGIQIVYQEVDMALYPTLSVAENIVQNDMVMGKSGYIVNWKKAYQQGEITDRERTIFVAYQYAASAVIINTISTQAPLLPIIKLAVGPVIVYLWIFKVLGANIMRLVVKKEAEGGAV